MAMADGVVTTDPQEMAQLLMDHWARVFGEAYPDPEALRRWFALADIDRTPFRGRATSGLAGTTSGCPESSSTGWQ